MIFQPDVVVDASALVEYLVASPTGRAVADLLDGDDTSLHIPELCVVETISVLRGWVRRGELTPERAAGAIVDLRDLPERRWPADPWIERIWDLRDNITSYDATCIALAETLHAALITADRRLARGAQAHTDCPITLARALT